MYTKGEWNVWQTDTKPADRWMICAGDTGDKGIVETVLDNTIPPAEKKANAHLIAAAPELQQAVVHLIGIIASCSPNKHISQEAISGGIVEGNEALAKAGGK